MGKTYSIYMDENEAVKVDELIKNGIKKADAVKKILYDRDKSIFMGIKEIRNDLTGMMDVLRDIRQAPVLQLDYGKKAPIVEIQQQQPRREGLFTRLKHKILTR